MYYIARYPNKDNVTVWRTTPLFANKVTLKAVVSGDDEKVLALTAMEVL